jgi:hypothetical protein
VSFSRRSNRAGGNDFSRQGGPVKTLQEREKELQTLIATPSGRAELQTMVDRYGAETGKVLPPRASLVTFILVHERQKGLIR